MHPVPERLSADPYLIGLYIERAENVVTDIGGIMHLSYSTSIYKGKTDKSYPIAESYHEGGEVRKRRELYAIFKDIDLTTLVDRRTG